MKKHFPLMFFFLFTIFWVLISCNKASEDHEHAELENQTSACMSCHSETTATGSKILSAKSQWSTSVHSGGIVESFVMGVDTLYQQEGSDAFYSNRGSCKKCHTHSGFLDKLAGIFDDLNDDYPSPIGCFTCHAPHANKNFELRVPHGTTVELLSTSDGTTKASFSKAKGTLCANCHQARAVYLDPETGDSWASYKGPHHGPQSDMLLGAVIGAEYDGKVYNDSAHTSNDVANCVTCHMATGTSLSPNVGWHSFNVVGVVHGARKGNANGCSISGCHTNIKAQTVASSSAVITTGKGYLPDDEVYFEKDGVALANQPMNLVNEALILLADPDNSCNGILKDAITTVGSADGTIAFTDTSTTPADCTLGTVKFPSTASDAELTSLGRAVWNFKLILSEDKSFGVHNTRYTLQLLHDGCEDLKTIASLAVTCLTTRP